MLQLKIHNIYHDETTIQNPESIEEQILQKVNEIRYINAVNVRIEWGKMNTPIFIDIKGMCRASDFTQIARIAVDQFSEFVPNVQDDQAVQSNNLILNSP